MTQPDRVVCWRCKLPIVDVAGVWVVLYSDTTADGLSFCPPNPDYLGPVSDHAPRRRSRTQETPTTGC